MSAKVKVATDYILDHIQNGSWPTGAKIPSENELCRELNISRTSVRAAIQQYISIGMLNSVHGKGTFVCSSSTQPLGHADSVEKSMPLLEELRLVHQARHIAEPEIFAYAAEYATPELIAQLEQCCKRMLESLGNQKEFIKADMDFHRLLVSFMENKYISAYYESLLTMEDINVSSNDLFGYYDGIHTHQMLLEAIKEHNPDKVRRLEIEYHEGKVKMLRDIMERTLNTAELESKRVSEP